MLLSAIRTFRPVIKSIPRLASRFASTVPTSPAVSIPRPIKHKKSSKPKPEAIPLPEISKSQSKAIKNQSLGQVIAISSADSYDVTLLLESLASSKLLSTAKNLAASAIYISTYKFTHPDGREEEAEIFVLESGTFVTWGSEESARSFLRNVIRGGAASGDLDWGYVEKGRALEPEVEVLSWSLSTSSEPETRMEGDVIILSTAPAPPKLGEISTDLMERLAFSVGMARATRLGMYEERFEVYADGVAGIPAALESGSESPVRKRDIVSRLGTLYSLRQSLNLEDENLLSEPEFLWNSNSLEKNYDEVCAALEFDSRLRILNQKVDYAFNLQHTLLDLLTAKTSHRLEWIIIILIASEIGLVIYREAPMSGASKEKVELGNKLEI